MRRVLLLILLLATAGWASKPVPRTLTGCVVGGVFYSLHESRPGTRPTVYRIYVQKMDLTRWEGRRIRLQGRLLPGDRFFPEAGSLKDLGACDSDSRKAIRSGAR